MVGWKQLESQPPIIPFQQVVDEQLASSLEQQPSLPVQQEVPGDCEDEQVRNDRKIAEILQHEFDVEHDRMVLATEHKLNGNEKIRRNLRNYLTCEPSSVKLDDLEQDISDTDDDDGLIEDEEFEVLMNKLRHGHVTKHDPELCAKRNLIRAMDSKNVGDSTGDVGRSCSGLSSSALNSLVRSSRQEESRRKARSDKQMVEKTQLVVDYRTLQMLFKLIEQSKLAFVGAIIATGKEATVVHSRTGPCFKSAKHAAAANDDDQNRPEFEPNLSCVIKIYHTTINEFRTRSRYIRDDYRFENRYKALNSYKVVCLWAEKELRNLFRIHESGIPCPRPLFLKRNALLMSFIGHDDPLEDGNLTQGAPCIANINDSEPFAEIYAQSRQIMKRLYQNCNLVHADMSEYNLLWFSQKVYVIDVSQAVENTHPESVELLMRDCRNMVKFFEKKIDGFDDSAENLFREITDISYEEASILIEERRRAAGGSGAETEHQQLWMNVIDEE